MALISTSACTQATRTSADANLANPQSEPETGAELAAQAEYQGFEHAFGTTENLAPLSPGQVSYLEEVVEHLEDAPPAIRHAAALAELMRAAAGRIPPRLAEDLLIYNQAEATKRAASLYAAIQNNLWLFDEVCGRSFSEVTEQSLALASRTAVNRYIWRECRLDRYPLLGSEADFVEVSARVGLEPMIAYFIYGYLDEHGGAHPLESQLLRTIARG